jgi:hypothetical protein
MKEMSMRRFHHSLGKYTRRSCLSSSPWSIPKVSFVKSKRRRHEVDILQGELTKINPLNLNGEHRKGQEVEAWLFEMNKYFQLPDYPSKIETRIVTYHL